MAITYVGQGGASAVTTATAPAYPTGILSGDLLILHVSSDATGIGSAPAGWTALGTVNTGGGMSDRIWSRNSNGAETGTQTVNVTSGTKGAAWIEAYRPNVGGGVLTPTLNVGVDSDSTSTAISATGSSWTVATGDMITAEVAMVTATTFAGNATSVAMAQAGGTVTVTARFAGRTGTNTVYYGHADALVTAGGTGAPSYTATANGANAAGIVAFVKLHEISNTAPTANAGTDQTVASGQAGVTLNGTGSSDPDGSISSYAWTQISGTAVTLSSATVAQPTFTAPTGPATLTFGLVVTDNLGATSSQDTVQITVSSPTNVAPTVSGDRSTLRAGEVATFTASDPDGTIASWAVTTGYTLAGTGGTRTLTAPPLATAATATVTVTDNSGATATASVLITKAPLRVYHNGAWRPAYAALIATTAPTPPTTTGFQGGFTGGF